MGYICSLQQHTVIKQRSASVTAYLHGFIWTQQVDNLW